MLLENQAGGGKQNPFASTLEQGNTQSRFQIAHLLGHAWLRYSETIRCAAKAARPGNGQEVAEVTNLNRILNHGIRQISLYKEQKPQGTWSFCTREQFQLRGLKVFSKKSLHRFCLFSYWQGFDDKNHCQSLRKYCEDSCLGLDHCLCPVFLGFRRRGGDRRKVNASAATSREEGGEPPLFSGLKDLLRSSGALSLGKSEQQLRENFRCRETAL